MSVVDLGDQKLERVPTLSGEVLSASAVRCLILKNNRLVYLPASLFDSDEDEVTTTTRWKHKTEEEGNGGDRDRGGCPTRLSALRVLDVANNRLSSIPSTIGNLASLTVLNLTSNRLTSLPPEIGRLANLRDLYLGGNELTNLPDQVGSCHSLRRLYLTSNPLRTLPLGLGSLQDELVVLELSGVSPTLTFPPKAVVKKGIQAILACLSQAKTEQRSRESQERRRAILAQLRETAPGPHVNEAERERNKRKQEKERMKEQMARMERSVLLMEIQNKRLELEKTHLQRKMVDLVVEKRRMQQQTQEMEERVSREEIRKQCVVCMDHPRSHVLLPCRHYIVCQRCVQTLRVCPLCRSPITQKLHVFDV